MAKDDKKTVQNLLNQHALDLETAPFLEDHQRQQLQKGMNILDDSHIKPILKVLKKRKRTTVKFDKIDDLLQIRAYNIMLEQINKQYKSFKNQNKNNNKKRKLSEIENKPTQTQQSSNNPDRMCNHGKIMKAVQHKRSDIRACDICDDDLAINSNYYYFCECNGQRIDYCFNHTKVQSLYSFFLCFIELHDL